MNCDIAVAAASMAHNSAHISLRYDLKSWCVCDVLLPDVEWHLANMNKRRVK